jgi:peptide/nickel transport system substrate-binding protein
MTDGPSDMSFLLRLRALLQRLFFWHGYGKQSSEFIPKPAHDHALVLNVTGSSAVPRWRQLRYAGRVLTLRERRVLMGMFALLVVAGSVAAWLTMRTRVDSVPAQGGRVVEAIIGSPKYPHPFYAATNDPDQDIVALVYAGLFARKPNTTSGPVPDLAESYTWSEDGKRLTLTLRSDVRFHDGLPLTAEDVAFTLNAAKDPAWKSGYVNALRGVAVELVDERTVALTLEKPDATLLDVLTVGILPAHIWQDVPPGTAHLAEANVRPVGAGPFRVRSFTSESHGTILAYTLERNDSYHGIKPLLQQLELRFFADRASAEEALRGGQVDTLAFVPGPSTEDLTKHNRLRASTIELPQETIAFFNVNDPILKDVKIRQALSLAVERNEIVDAQAGRSAPVVGPFPFEEPPSATSTTPEERLEEARKLLETAGWVTPPDKELRVRKESLKSATTSAVELSVTITTPDVPDLMAVADALKRRWSLLGIRVELKAEQAESLARRIMSDRNGQVILWNVLLSPSQDQRPVWWSGEATGRGLNLSNLTDRNVDDALDAIRAATTTDAIARTRVAFTQAVLTRAPAVFLTRPGYGYVHSVRVKGMTDQLQLGKPSDRLSDIINWHVKTAWNWK